MNPKEVKYMAKRRPAGDGMVRKREDGRWEAAVSVSVRAGFIEDVVSQQRDMSGIGCGKSCDDA